jgi:hypothetical protein
MSVGNSVGKLTRSEMHLMHRPLESAQSVGDLVGNIIRRQMTDGFYSVGKFVGIVAFQVIIFELSMKCRRPLCTSVCTSVIVVFQVIIFKLSVKCRWTLFRRYGRR